MPRGLLGGVVWAILDLLQTRRKHLHYLGYTFVTIHYLNIFILVIHFLSMSFTVIA